MTTSRLLLAAVDTCAHLALRVLDAVMSPPDPCPWLRFYDGGDELRETAREINRLPEVGRG